LIRVLIVDDQALVRAGFRMILRRQPDFEVVGEAADGEGAVAQAARLRPDVVLMDVRMPGVDGIEATRRIGLETRHVRVIILTTFDLDEYVYDALEAGASGFLLKDTQPEQLVTAVRVVAAGDALLAPSVTRRLIAQFARQRPRPAARGRLSELTGRETEVLNQLARGLSNREIAVHLSVSETTVKTHVANVLGKLGLRDRVQAAIFAHEAGLDRHASS
jgi:DNA-binding NarL/FixJ family response regulator